MEHFIDGWKVSEVGRRQQDIQLYSAAQDQWKVVCVQVCPELESNWIDRRIVKRLHLRSRKDDSLMEAEYEGIRLQASGKVVDLIGAENDGNKSSRHRFHIVKDAPFDMLFGANLQG